MKTPISYYGGKQRMAKQIISLVPQHKVYVEPFFGGGAIYFAKPKSDIEVINDLNNEVINFFKVLQHQFDDLERLVNDTLHSRLVHKTAQTIYEYPLLFNSVHRAWALWVLSKQSFACKLDGSFGYDKTTNTQAKKMYNAKKVLSDARDRIEFAQIECNDALKVISSRDSEQSFHYVDPPYFNSDCGHYSGYTEEDFERLLELLTSIKGKFLLSSYPSELLEHFTKEQGWFTIKKEVPLAITGNRKKPKMKVEVLTANYDLREV